jgi:hypothetical protein
MFRTSRAAGQTDEQVAWMGPWPRPAYGLSRATCVVILARAVVAALSSRAVAASPTRGATYAHGTPGDKTEVEMRVSPRGRRFADTSSPCS